MSFCRIPVVEPALEPHQDEPDARLAGLGQRLARRPDEGDLVPATSDRRTPRRAGRSPGRVGSWTGIPVSASTLSSATLLAEPERGPQRARGRGPAGCHGRRRAGRRLAQDQAQPRQSQARRPRRWRPAPAGRRARAGASAGRAARPSRAGEPRAGARRRGGRERAWRCPVRRTGWRSARRWTPRCHAATPPGRHRRARRAASAGRSSGHLRGREGLAQARERARRS